MKLNSPLPQPLPKECLKASKIFKSFVDNGNNGLDGIIPRQVLENAKGFAIFTIIKAGFLFSARAGSGVVIAKLDDGTWSAPSAIGTAGLGVGGQVGAEMTDFLIVLNSRSAVRSFMSAGSLTLGGNMSIALGPLGRNGEALGSLNTSGRVAAMYSYSKTRGLFGGVSVEGSVIVERQDANSLAYQTDVTVKQLLSGAVAPPHWAQPLIKTLEACVGMPGGQKWVDDSADAAGFGSSGSGKRDAGSRYAFGAGSGAGLSSPGSELPSSTRRGKGLISSPFPPSHWGGRKSGGSYFNTESEGEGGDYMDDGRLAGERDVPRELRTPHTRSLINDTPVTNAFPTHFDSDFTPPSATQNGGIYPKATHRPSLSVNSHFPHVSTFNPKSPFNDLPPFPRIKSGNLEGPSHNRSASTMSYVNPSSSVGPDFSAAPKSGRNPFSTQVADPFCSDFRSNTTSGSPLDRSAAFGETAHITPKLGPNNSLSSYGGVGRAVALYNFRAVEAGDLSFNKGQVIIITKKSDRTDDWWTGRLDDKEGIFPANFVEVV